MTAAQAPSRPRRPSRRARRRQARQDGEIQSENRQQIEVKRGQDHRRNSVVARARHRRGDRQRQDRGAVLEAGVLGLREIQEWMAETKPDVAIVVYNDHASAFSVEIDPDLRARLRRGISAGRRGLGPAAGAGGQGPSGARLAYRPVGHSRRVRPHHRQQDGGRSRPDRAAEPVVRQVDPIRNGRARSFRSPSTW